MGTHIAGRSLEADPRGTARAVSLIGIVLVVGVLGIGFVRAIDAGAANADTAPPDTAVVDQVHTPDLPEAIRHSLTTPVAPVWALTGATPTGPEGVLVARCRDLTEVIRGARGCRSGALVHRLPSASSQMMGAGQQLDLDLGDPDATVAGELRPSATVHTAAPRLLLPEDPGRLFGGRSGTVLVDPEAPGLTVVRQRAPDLVLVRLRVPSDADRLREVLAEVDPLAQIHTSASYRAAWQAEQPLDARAAEALLAAIVSLVLAAVGVTTVDRITARRPLDVQILALGAPRGEVRRAAAMAVLLPATAVVPAVAITVLLADLSWDRVIHEPLAIDTVVLASLAAATAVLAALAAVLAITVTRVEAQPEALHRE